MKTNLMNDRVLNTVHECARGFYEGTMNSVEARQRMDRVAGSAFNFYEGVFNECRELFDTLVESFISEDVDNHRQLNYAAQEVMNQVKQGPNDGEDFFRVKVGGSHWFNVSAAQLRSFAMALDTDAPPSAFEV